MYVRLSKLRKVVAEQAQHLFEELKQEDRDRVRRWEDGYPGESGPPFEEAIELEDFEFAEAKKKNEEEPEEDVSGDDSEEKEEPKKAKKEKGDEEVSKQPPSPKHKKAKKGLEKAQKQKALPKTQVDPKSGRKQELDLDQLAQLATEAGYRLEKLEPEEEGVPEDDLGMEVSDDLPGDDDEMDFGLDDLGLGGDEEELAGDDVEGEDVAIVSSDEDLEDALGLGDDEEVEDEGMRLDIEGHPLSMKKAGTILKHGEVKGHPLSKKQKGLFGAIKGGVPLKKY